MDDLFLAMQGQNVMLVDFYLRDLERDLLRELVETERTPYLATVIVSALSQMWIFAVYELLRTWRQRIKRFETRRSKASSARFAAFEPCRAALQKSARTFAHEARLCQGTRSSNDSYAAALQAD